MDDQRSIAYAIWSRFSRGNSPVPEWFGNAIEFGRKTVPSRVADDFMSMLTIELLQAPGTADTCESDLRIIVRRAMDRVRQRLLTEIGFTSRAAYRREAAFATEPISNAFSNAQDEAIANDLLRAILDDLSAMEALILTMRLDGKSTGEIAASLHVTARTVQRAFRKIADVIARTTKE